MVAPASFYGWAVAPFVRDLHVIVFGVLLWFAVQHAAHYIAIRASRSYRKLPPPAQSELDVRVVCIVNSLVSLRTVYIYFTEAWYVPAGGMYFDIVSYRPCLALFISYFIWDVIVCFQFHWGAAFTVHAFASLFGTYSLSYPVSDYHSSYFGGCFECCNMVNHAAAILKLLKKAPRVVAALEYVFVFMFYTVRVAGGTVVSYHWFADIFSALYNGTAHAAVPLVTAGVCLATIMALQYVWAVQIVLVAVGIVKPAVPKK